MVREYEPKEISVRIPEISSRLNDEIFLVPENFGSVFRDPITQFF